MKAAYPQVLATHVAPAVTCQKAPIQALFHHQARVPVAQKAHMNQVPVVHLVALVVSVFHQVCTQVAYPPFQHRNLVNQVVNLVAANLLQIKVPALQAVQALHSVEKVPVHH